MTSVALITSIAYSVPNFRASLITSLIARGARVVALAPDYDDATRARVRALGAEPVDISLQRAGLSPARDAADMVRLWGTLWRLKPDAVLNYFAKPVIYGSLAAAAARVPRRVAMIEGLGYVFGDEGAETSKRKLLRRVTQTMYRTALASVDTAIFLNADDHDLFVERHIVGAKKARNIGGVGVRLDDFAVTPPQTDPVTFLLMARLLREKGVGEYVAAARMLKREFPAARFVLLGGLDPNPSGFQLAEIEEWVREGAIEWPGHVDDVRPWVARASAFVLPSYYREGVPRSIQEAMAMGKPIITTDNVGCRDTVEEGINGFLVPKRDVAALAAAMRRLIVQPETIAPMGLASRRLAEERFDARRTDGLLTDLLLG
jgi:glycosyltransferase involved in cell wall biosynthesis